MSIFGQRPPPIFIDRSVEYVTRDVRVTEQRAPTDDGVRLLREMEEAAQKRVIEAIRVNNTEFDCVTQLMRDAMTGEVALGAVFRLNGKQMKAEYRSREPFRDTSLAKLDPKLWRGLAEEIGKVIADEIVVPAMQSMMRGS